MLFNSIDFAIFLPIVFGLYWFVINRNLKHQNMLILVASLVFYGWWDWRFLSLLLLSSFVDFFVGLKVYKHNPVKKRRMILLISLIFNIGLLGFFKYYNFFVDSFVNAFTFFGHSIPKRNLNIILPVGISFYTFQTLSYSIDIYRRKLKPTKDLVAFLAFVSFFPQLVAGPIERASNLLPQFHKKRVFNYTAAADGLRQMLWGLFKKVVVADNLSKLVEPIFDNTSQFSSYTLLLGLAMFSVQIYADFSGYSDIAIGTGRLFGFNLKINFRYPLFARSIGERWRNWHISLSTWFRDYIYIPMGGSRGSKWNKFKNVVILFTISGFWHGANWTFVFWGLANGLLFAPSMLLNKNRTHLEPISKKKLIPNLKEGFQMFTTFWLIAFTYMFFRADNLSHSRSYFNGIINNVNLPSLNSGIMNEYGLLITDIYKALIFVLMMLFVEWSNRDKEHGLYFSENNKQPLFRWGIYILITFIIFWWAGDQETFIYFQF